jgi:hypothetical protein
VNTLIIILNVIVAFITFYEGRSVIRALRNHRVEASPEHIIHIKDTKREMIFLHEIEKVKVVESLTGKVKKIKILTKDRQTILEHYESLEELITLIKEGTSSELQIIRPKMASFLSVLVPVIAVASLLVT